MLAAASIDDGRRTDDPGTRFAGNGNRLARGAAGRDDVLDHENGVRRGERKAAAQREPAVLPLDEEGPETERARNFLTDDDAADGGREDDRRAQAARLLGESAPARLGLGRMLQYERRLHVAGAVQA